MMDKWKCLLHTARPKTLAASWVPILVGSSLAIHEGYKMKMWVAVWALISATFIQIGTNFVNDALDFKKGADTSTRLGEARATQSGWFSYKQVLMMGIGSLALAFAFGVPLVSHGGWPIVLIGLLSIAMAYAYTGGPWPLAYLGLGDLFVVLFFGLIAVGGVYYLQTSSYSLSAAVAGLQVGLLATVMIAINNLRDLDQDKLVDKRTLAVRLGPVLGRWEVVFLLASAFSLNGFWFWQGKGEVALFPLFLAPLAVHVCWGVLKNEASPFFNQLLARSALLHMLFGIALCVGFVQR